MLLAYGGILSLLAERAMSGDLAIKPAYVENVGEDVSYSRAEIEDASGCPLLTQYHSTELPYSCLPRDERGHYRQMGDWFC